MYTHTYIYIERERKRDSYIIYCYTRLCYIIAYYSCAACSRRVASLAWAFWTSAFRLSCNIM